MVHIEKIVNLWELLSNVHLVHNVPNKIYWKFTNDGKYSASSAYKMQFEGLISTMVCLGLKSLGSTKRENCLLGWLC
jgi:hypothetical protein